MTLLGDTLAVVKVAKELSKAGTGNWTYLSPWAIPQPCPMVVVYRATRNRRLSPRKNREHYLLVRTFCTPRSFCALLPTALTDPLHEAVLWDL